MATSFGRCLLSVFEISEDSRDFLISLIDSGVAPAEEVQSLLQESLMAGAEAFHNLIDCARSLQQAQRHRLSHLAGHDLLAFIWAILNDCHHDCHDIERPAQPWVETDRLIGLAREQQQRDVEVRPPTCPAKRKCKGNPACLSSPRKRRSQGIHSHYWSNEPLKQDEGEQRRDRNPARPGTILPVKPRAAYLDLHALHQQSIEQDAKSASTGPACCPKELTPLDCASRSCEPPGLLYGSRTGNQSTNRKSKSTESPYFFKPEPQRKETPRIRPPAGTVSCVPFPPLTAPRFGLIQEEVAHEPFWLLIAITFLIKTNGKLAIPAFRKVKKRFPTLRELLEPDNEEELLGMIQHLGLPKVRLGYIQRYARAFLEEPPTARVRYRVRNYDRRDLSPSFPNSPGGDDSQEFHEPESLVVGHGEDGMQDLEAWEIGHMTQGKYAIDSWRIFCRDSLLGRARDWNGAGREPEFQPEWMRTRPADKELRAYLMWMWMREGWEWDAATGERRVLREEMRRAVEEGRVEYDEVGALRILVRPGEDEDADADADADTGKSLSVR